MDIKPEPIKRYADYQINWNAVIEPLRNGRYVVEERSIHGDAPKSFIKIKEFAPGRPMGRVRHWPGYIAKVGAKRYPTESITEHLLTRIGQAFCVNIAESRLRIVAGQVRFLSKYFLTSRESLVHGLEIFRRHLDDDMVNEIASRRQEREFYTFQTVAAAINDIYRGPAQATIMDGIVEMLAFDAIVGNNDRHPLNWGVVVPLAPTRPIKFAPVFDTARGLFWNLDDEKLGAYLDNAPSMERYVNHSFPQIGWDGHADINHFELVRFIHRNYPNYRERLEKFSNPASLSVCDRIIEAEFVELMSDVRRNAIRSCLALRQEYYRDATNLGA